MILKSKTQKRKEKELNLIAEIVKFVTDEHIKIWKRCALEGCRYGYEPIDKEPTNKCIYCGEPRNYYFDNLGPVRSIQKSLKKIRPKGLL